MSDSVVDAQIRKSYQTVLIANPSPDVYGSDLQMLQSVAGLVERGMRVVVALPVDGELVERLQSTGAEVIFIAFPVLRKSYARPRALVSMLYRAIECIPRCLRLVAYLKPDVLIVNTVTLPWWLLIGRLSRTPTIGHLHEAETQVSRIVRGALIAPLFLANAVIVISESALSAMLSAQPRLAGRTRLIYNGVPQPPDEPRPARRGQPIRLAIVGRLSPRKAPDVAIEATALLRAQGYDVTLEVAGTTFSGYEWYEDQLRVRAQQDDLAGAVNFSGYNNPIWPVLDLADIVLAPSLQEPFGNAVVEAQMSKRPVVAAAAMGHLESTVDGQTGLLVTPGDALEMADAVARLIVDEELATRLAEHGRDEAVRRFSVSRYRREVVALVESLTPSR